MDHSWHAPPPPPIQGSNICPFCSFSHFPFCPPPLPPNPSCNFHYPPPPPPPPYQPLPPPPPPPPPLPQPPPPAAAPYDPFVDHRVGGPHVPQPHYGNNINPSSFDYYGVNKRMRVDDSTNQYMNEKSMNVASSFDYGSVGVVNKRMHIDDMTSQFVSEKSMNLVPSFDYGNNVNKRVHIDDSMSQFVSEKSMNVAPSFDYGNIVNKRTDLTSQCVSEKSMNLAPRFDYGNNVGVVTKRMRIDDSTGQFVNEKSMNLGRFEANNERRLNLINEFGAPNHELDGGRYGNFDGFVGSKNSNSSYSYKDSGYGNLDRKQTFHDQDEMLRLRYQSRESGYEEFDNNLPRQNGYKYVGPQDDQQNYEGSRYSSRYGVSGTNKLYHEQTSNVPVDDRGYSHHYSEAYAMQNHMESKPNHSGSPYDQRVSSVNRSGMSSYSVQGSTAFAIQPPLPASPPPPLPMEPPLPERLVSSSPPGISASMFPVSGGSSAPLSSSYSQVHEDKSMSRYQANLHVSSRSAMEEIHMHQYTSSSISSRGSEHPLRDLPLEKSKVIDASHILKHPYRASRPDHLVIILRGLPGSGKSYLAKMLRDLEVENGGTAPRIHSMDEYFMTEVDKVEESEVSKSTGSIRGKKMATKKVMEYCYEPEMEEAYRSSMLKAFKKTLDEGAFSFVIVDDRNLRVADFAQFWATAKRSGYEVYLLEATYKDPAGCAARNVHGFTRNDVQKMAGLWEEAPSMYWKLDVKSLLHGDALEEGGIQEVDMDMEDDDSLSVPSTLADESIEKDRVPPQEDIPADGNLKGDHELDHEVDHRITKTKELSKSKWSSNLDEDDARRNEDATKNLNALSGLIQSYSKDGKSVRWSDQVTKRGFSIGAAKATNVSLVIGPGAGYNLKSNPLPEEEKLTSTRNNGEPKRQNIFQERLRAERESFRAVFESFRTGSDKKRQRIVGLAADDE